MTNENQYRELFTPINIVTAVAVLALHTYIGFALAHMQVHQLKIPEIKEIAPIEVMLVKAMGQKSLQQHKSQSPGAQQPKVEPKPKPATKPKQKPAAKIKPKPITKPKPRPTPVAKPKPEVVPKPIVVAKPVITVDKRLQQQRQWEIEQQREAKQEAKLKAEREVQLAATKRAKAEARARAEADAAVRAAAKAAASKGSGVAATKAKGSTGSGGGGAANKAQAFSESDASWKREPNFKRLASIRTSARSGDVLKFSIKLTVDKQGNVTRAQVTRSSGYPRLDRAAERIAKKGKLNPFKNSSGNAVLGYVTLPFEYRVN